MTYLEVDIGHLEEENLELGSGSDRACARLVSTIAGQLQGKAITGAYG
jgi:hypothetical protein